MQIGMIGLGRMGASIVTRLLRGQHDCVVGGGVAGLERGYCLMDSYRAIHPRCVSQRTVFRNGGVQTGRGR